MNSGRAVFRPESITLDDAQPDWGLWWGSFLSRPFNTAYVILTLIFLLAVSPSGDKTRCLCLAAVLNFSLVQGIKQFCWLPRPVSPGQARWGKGRRSGFPSGHTVPGFLLACLVAHFHPLLGALWFAFATAIAWSRVRVRAHYAYQVIVSAALGCAIGFLVCR